jgi:hypothetical protein
LFYSVNGIGKGVWGLIGYKTDKSDETIDSLTVTEKDNTYTKKDFFSQVYITEKTVRHPCRLA